jgi:hypothetical protein
MGSMNRISGVSEVSFSSNLGLGRPCATTQPPQPERPQTMTEGQLDPLKPDEKSQEDVMRHTVLDANGTDCILEQTISRIIIRPELVGDVSLICQLCPLDRK